MNNLISVIITCYNEGKLIYEAIESVLSQTYKNLEIIVVNDGSTDEKTLEVLSSIKNEKITIFHKDNGNVSSARNFGVKQCKGDFFIPLDADDKLHPEFVEKTFDIIRLDEKIAAVSSYAQLFGKKNDLKILHGGDLKNFLFYNNCIVCALIRKDIWIKNGGYDENMKVGFEDWEFWINTTKKGYRIFVIPEPLYFYRIKNYSRTTNSLKNRPEIYYYIIKKHQDVYDQFYPEIILELEKKVLQMEEIYQNSLNYRIGKIILCIPKIMKKLFATLMHRF